MSRTAAERRAARKRKAQTRQRPPVQPSDGQETRGQRVHRLVSDGARGPDALRHAVSAELARVDPTVDETGFVADLLVGVLQRMWEHGWQPADAAHVIRRRGTARLTRLACAAIAEEARLSAARTRAPEDWRGQLDALDALSGRGPSFVAAWHATEGLPAAESWRDVVDLLGLLTRLPVLQQLTAPPSQWGTAAASSARSSTADERVLGRIRALLAKAESTEFPEEAEALTAKAQELMTRHAVDTAALSAGAPATKGQVGARRVHIDNPYPEAKVRLLDAVAGANGVRVVWLDALGIATAVGLPVDLESVELLFTSLLVQATRAMTATGKAAGTRTRSPSFRRAFLESYAARIGERLRETRDRTTEEAAGDRGIDLLPVLRARTQAVDDAFSELFPDTYGVSSRAFDVAGWRAGRLAAEDADLGSGRAPVRG